MYNVILREALLARSEWVSMDAFLCLSGRSGISGLDGIVPAASRRREAALPKSLATPAPALALAPSACWCAEMP